MVELFEETQYFICPITQEIMDDPVIASDGQTYERKAITTWLDKNMTSPLSNLPLANSNLIPNHLVKSLINDYKEKRQKRTEPEVKILKPKKKCFKEYSEFSQSQIDMAERALARLRRTTKLDFGTLEREWKNLSGDIYKTFEWLSQLGMKKASYGYLAIEFRQYLSEKTQADRHSLKDAKGKHASTEQFWEMNENLHVEWIKDFLESS